jgi:bifunctional DNA-binding transcriptional regulator/antitoxin component of YhaV-PrlF toxin-antitoxin module
MEDQDKNSDTSAEKIQSLREMIMSAERTIQGAKAMLLQLEGKKKVGRKRKTMEDGDEGRIIEGTFDGQIMIGSDGKQYPVPANYASKSKLIEGDMLKLTITGEGSFIYKQIGPIERRRLLGIVNQDADGNYFIIADGKPFRVLLASITYFKVEPGDEVTLVTPRDMDSDWASIENVIQKSRDAKPASHRHVKPDISNIYDDLGGDTETHQTETTDTEAAPKKPDTSIFDEWAPDLEDLKKELNNNKDL